MVNLYQVPGELCTLSLGIFLMTPWQKQEWYSTWGALVGHKNDRLEMDLAIVMDQGPGGLRWTGHKLCHCHIVWKWWDSPGGEAGGVVMERVQAKRWGQWLFGNWFINILTFYGPPSANSLNASSGDGNWDCLHFTEEKKRLRTGNSFRLTQE